MEVRKDKYCLKGEYYEALETINCKIAYSVPRAFRKEVNSDVMELLYRNQQMGKPLKSVIGNDIDEFIGELIESFYGTLSKRKIMNYMVQCGLFYSMICMVFFISNSIVDGGNIEAFSLAAVVFSIVGFVAGISYVFISKNYIYKLTGVKRSIIQIALILVPLYFVDFGDKLIYKLTNEILIAKEYILIYLLIQIALYVLLVIRFKRSEKSE